MWETDEGSVVATAGATIEVNGSTSPVEVGVDLKDVVLTTAKNAGYKKFRFYINGEEVLPQDAPSVTAAGDAYKITAFDVAGGGF